MLEIAALPDQIRGYESIRVTSIATVKKLAMEKLAQLRENTRLDANPLPTH